MFYLVFLSDNQQEVWRVVLFANLGLIFIGVLVLYFLSPANSWTNIFAVYFLFTTEIIVPTVFNNIYIRSILSALAYLAIYHFWRWRTESEGGSF